MLPPVLTEILMTIINNMICEVASPINDCIKYLKSNPIEDMPLGKYVINDDGTYVIIQEYITKSPEECDWEALKKYVDFQYIISGEEKMYVSELSDMKQGVYDEDIDFTICFGNAKEKIIVGQGSGIVFMPDDVHMPCLHSGEKPSNIRKAVFKIPVKCF